MILRLTTVEKLLRRLHLLPTPVMDAFGGVIFGRALAIAVRRGLFEMIAAGPAGIEEISRSTGLSAPGTRLLVDSFVAGGYLKRSAGVYSVSGESEKWLLKGSPTYLGNLILYFETLYPRWEGMEYSLDHGGPRHPSYASFSDRDWEIYLLGMRDLARLLWPDILPRLHLPSGHLLDIGGSHGLFAIECCRRAPSLQAIIMDFEPVVRRSADFVHEAGMDDRVRFLSGDFLTTPLPPGQDTILMFNIVHGFDASTNRALVERAMGALAPGGRLYILDQIRAENRRSPLAQFIPLMVGLNLLNEIGGYAFSEEEVRSWCGEAGRIRVMPLRLPGVSLVEATKRGTLSSDGPPGV